MSQGLRHKLEHNPEVALPPLLAALHQYWTRKCEGRAMPRRHDIAPGEIKGQLSHVLLADVIGDGRDFRYRLVGTALHRNFPSLPTGRLMSELLAPFGDLTVRQTISAYREVVTTRLPSRLRGAGAWYGQEPKYFDAILMPLSDDGENVNMIFGGFFFEWDRDNAFRDAPEDIGHWHEALRRRV